MTRIEQALVALLTAIGAGAEFPNVVGRIARRYRITERTLTKAYDRAQAEG